MATKFYDLVKCTVTGNPGTGNITLGAAVTGWRGPSGVIANGAEVSYGIEEGADHEASTGVYNSSTGVLTRVFGSSSTGVALSLTSAAIVHITALAGDVELDPAAAIAAMDAEL